MDSIVSIVIPFKNHRDFIESAIENIKRQVFQSWELVLVSNQSSDGSLEIAKQQAEKSAQRIRCVEEKKLGIPFSRNRGLQEARGKYVCFLDVDDEYAPEKLKDQVEVLESHPDVAMVYGLTRRIYKESGREVIQDRGIVQEGVNEPPYLAMDWIKNFYHLPQTGATLVRTEIARDLGGFDETLLMGNDDVAFHLKLAFDYKIAFVAKEAVFYYRHEQSEGHRLNQKNGVHERYLNACEWALSYSAEYEKKTGDSRPRYWAERAYAGNLARYAFEKKKKDILEKMFIKQRERRLLTSWYFRVFFFFYRTLPFKAAKFFSRVFYRLLYWVSPKKFPLKIPKFE